MPIIRPLHRTATILQKQGKICFFNGDTEISCWFNRWDRREGARKQLRGTFIPLCVMYVWCMCMPACTHRCVNVMWLFVLDCCCLGDTCLSFLLPQGQSSQCLSSPGVALQGYPDQETQGSGDCQHSLAILYYCIVTSCLPGSWKLGHRVLWEEELCNPLCAGQFWNWNIALLQWSGLVTIHLQLFKMWHCQKRVAIIM